MTAGFGFFRVDEGDLARKSGFENRDKLGSEGDFWDEKNDGFALQESGAGEL